MTWDPHVTVASIVENDGKFLMVEERSAGKIVFNQPAGHVDGHESLAQAAKREAFEETSWDIQLTGVVGYYAYTSPINNVTYYRVTYAAIPLEQDLQAALDPDIIQAHWLSYEEISARHEQLRSPIVLKSLDDYRRRAPAPLDFIFESHPKAWLR